METSMHIFIAYYEMPSTSCDLRKKVCCHVKFSRCEPFNLLNFILSSHFQSADKETVRKLTYMTSLQRKKFPWKWLNYEEFFFTAFFLQLLYDSCLARKFFTISTKKWLLKPFLREISKNNCIRSMHTLQHCLFSTSYDNIMLIINVVYSCSFVTQLKW